jgi:hypothetical protein
MPFDQETQKTRSSLIARESGALQDPLQLPKDSFVPDFATWH